MKKIYIFIIGLISSLLLINNVNAATANVKVTANSTKLVVGNTVRVKVTITSKEALGSWEYSLNYNKDLVELISSDVPPHYVAAAPNANTKTVTYNYNFKARKSGKVTFNTSSVAVLGWNEQYMGVNLSGATVNILTKAELEASLSKDNYLKTLTIEGYEISFDKEKLDYSLIVENDVKQITIKGTKQDSRSKVSGLGTVDLIEGLNKVYVVVTAQNGSKRTYTINVTVKELEPINVLLNDVQYSVVRSLDGVNIPETFILKEIELNDKMVGSLYNEVADITLLLLKDENGDTYFFEYDNEQYQEFNYLNFGNLYIKILKIKDVIDGYVKSNEVLNGLNIETLKSNNDSEFSLLYGLNLETNEENYYSYDEKENTIQRYVKSEQKKLPKIKEDRNVYLWLAVIFATISIILLVTLISVVSNKRKPKDSIEKPKKEKSKKKQKKKKKDVIDEWFEG